MSKCCKKNKKTALLIGATAIAGFLIHKKLKKKPVKKGLGSVDYIKVLEKKICNNEISLRQGGMFLHLISVWNDDLENALPSLY